VVDNGPNKIFGDPNRSREEYVIGIETSFDESAASIVNSWGEIKANQQMTQWEQWDEFDGIQPSIAKEIHKKNLPIVVQRVMDEVGLKKGDPRLKAIAVTMGPGQEMSINVGLFKAQELGRELGVPVIPVSHIEGHVMVRTTI
jgi:N6-L-threonylcarbamoyladenine synthase